jgi:serine protease Do
MFAALAERLRASSVLVAGGGSGVIWASDGLVVTNAHVVREQMAEVVLSDGRRLKAALVARDGRRDLAALRVIASGSASGSASGLPAVELGNSERLRVGQLVMAVGNPLGIAGAVTVGIIHAIGPLRVRGQEWIQADVSLAPGNSGGLLADAEGRVIGINTMIFGGLALAVPVNAISRFLAEGLSGARAA